MSHPRFRGLFVGVALAAPALAQFTPISGALTGTLTPGVYHAVGYLTVPAGQSLTLDPGVIIKAVGVQYVQVDGTLIANGTAANPVIFTDDDDDSAGGDTNGNGPSVGAPGAWYGMAFTAAAGACALSHAEVRFAGYGNYPGIGVASSGVALDHCAVRSCHNHGLRLESGAAPSVTSCVFTDNGGVAIHGATIQAVPGCQDNTATGNGGNYLQVTAATVAGALTLQPSSMINGALMCSDYVTVPTGASLTLQAGTVIKFLGVQYVQVFGSLNCNGTAANPVIFTEDDDDSAGGDTNGNGASAGVPGAWWGMYFDQLASGCALSHTEARFAGYGAYPGIGVAASGVALAHCAVRSCYALGLRLAAGARPTVTACAFTDNGGVAVYDATIGAVPGFQNNTATGNGGNYLQVTAATVAGALTLQPSSMINGVLMCSDYVTVPTGTSLTLEAGMIFKFVGVQYVQVFGVLVCNGTAANPVIFTEDDDDSAGGDSTGNGPTVGAAGAWWGTYFDPLATACALRHTEIRFGGYGSYAGVTVNTSSPSFERCTIRDNYADGMNLVGTGMPTVVSCAFRDNGGTAVDAVPIRALPGFVDNTAAGIGQEFLRVTTATVDGPLAIGAQSMLNGAIVLATGIQVTATGALDVLQGVTFKMEGVQHHLFAGATRLRGTAYEPVVFTDDDDDACGGDTNCNGPSAGVPGSWYGIEFPSSAAARSAENVIVRFPGYGSYPGVACDGANVALRAVRVDAAYGRGFALSAAAANPANLVAWSCGTQGFHLTGGAFDLVHATSAQNGVGMRAEPAWTGAVRNSIARENTIDLQNFTAAEFVRSDGGFAGQNGCIDQDPRFVDLPNGDLHLRADSPCLDAADYATAVGVQKDFGEYPRVLDHALMGLALPDMGAHERCPWHMAVHGPSKLGSTVFLTEHGPAGDSFLGFGLMDGTRMLQPYGQILAGMPGGALALVFAFPIAVGTPIPLAVPGDPAFVGTIIGLQTLNLQQGNWARGAFSELYRVYVRP